MATINSCIHKTKTYLLIGDKSYMFVNSVYLDKAFQRNVRWKELTKQAFLKSLVTGRAPSPIIVASVRDCLDMCVEGSDDYTYFENVLDKGYEYISIDGNNRTQTLIQFLNNTIGLKPGTYSTSGGPVTITNKNNTFNKLPKVLKDKIKDEAIFSVCEYAIPTKADLSDLFECINDGVPLNAAEKRNAKLVPIAEAIRNMAIEHEAAFRFAFEDNSGYKFDEQIAILAVYYTNGNNSGISKTNLDSAYSSESDVYNKFKTGGGQNLINTTLSIIGKYADAGFKDKSLFLNFFMVMKQLQKDQRQIVDQKALLKWFMATENSRRASEDVVYAKNRGDTKTYATCCRQMGKELLLARFNVIFKDLMKIPDGIVTELDPERLFTPAQRYNMWVKQNGICPATGKQIPEDEINNHELWAADHIIPYILGGETTLENGQLVCKKYNLQKSSKMLKAA